MSSIYEIYHKDFVKTKQQDKIINSKNFTYINFFRFILPIIQQKRPAKILDLGSGAGTLSFFLSNLGFQVTGIDISKYAVNSANLTAKSLNLQRRAKFIKADFEKFSSNEKFDVIMALEVLEHIKNDDLALQKLHDLLDSNGLLILSTPLSTAPLVRLNLTRGFDKRVGHLRRYVDWEILNKLNSVDFNVLSVVKTEGIIRNSLFVFPYLTLITRFIKSYIADFITMVDDFCGELFGYSDIIILARKK